MKATKNNNKNFLRPNVFQGALQVFSSYHSIDQFCSSIFSSNSKSIFGPGGPGPGRRLTIPVDLSDKTKKVYQSYKVTRGSDITYCLTTWDFKKSFLILLTQIMNFCCYYLTEAEFCILGHLQSVLKLSFELKHPL